MSASTSLTATFPGQFKSLEKISQFVQKAASQAGLDEEALYSVELAVDEACSNIIEHAYQAKIKGISSVFAKSCHPE
ncbi:MAG: ATP-binding protein [Anaerolineae bacterium]|nr:ATP-binding protein [Anaerolineae bacterium]